MTSKSEDSQESTENSRQHLGRATAFKNLESFVSDESSKPEELCRIVQTSGGQKELE